MDWAVFSEAPSCTAHGWVSRRDQLLQVIRHALEPGTASSSLPFQVCRTPRIVDLKASRCPACKSEAVYIDGAASQAMNWQLPGSDH